MACGNRLALLVMFVLCLSQAGCGWFQIGGCLLVVMGLNLVGNLLEKRHNSNLEKELKEDLEDLKKDLEGRRHAKV